MKRGMNWQFILRLFLFSYQPRQRRVYIIEEDEKVVKWKECG